MKELLSKKMHHILWTSSRPGAMVIFSMGDHSAKPIEVVSCSPPSSAMSRNSMGDQLRRWQEEKVEIQVHCIAGKRSGYGE